MTKFATFGGGCFWCTEAVFQMLRGVSKVQSGYAGGETDNPSYDDVSGGATNHAEVIQVTYDPAIISYEDLLTVFFGVHDPTTLNRQGYDVGKQYRSIILYQEESEKETALRMIKEIEASLKDMTAHGDDMPIVTQVVPLVKFYPAEGYHQNFYKQNKGNRYCDLIIEPKIKKVRKRFAELVNSET